MGRLKDSFIKFEPTHASEEILLAITQNRCVLITGPFGSGKTIIANYIVSKLEQEGYEIIFASDSVDIDRRFNRNQRQLFLIDDILGKYSSNVSDITDKLERCGSAINSILKQSFTVKVLITCRTYMFQLYAQNFESLRRHVSLIHKNLISENLRLNLEERKKMFKLYFESDPPKSISDDILLLYNFYPVMCSSNNKDNLLECFFHPVYIISAEIDSMRKKSDFGYLALAILVVMNNKVEISKLCGSSYSENTDIILQDVLNESCFNQCPLKHMLRETFMSLKGEFITEDDTFLSFLCPELFDIVAVCIGGFFMQSILSHSSSGFIKDKLRLSQTLGNDCAHTVKVQYSMESEFYQRLTSDMNNKLFFDVLSNTLFYSPNNRETFVGYLEKHLKSKNLVDAKTGSNVLHIISSLGYSDFLTYFLKYDNCPRVNKKDPGGETPLHLACKYGHLRCVQCLIKYKDAVSETGVYKRTALHYASEAGNEEIVKYLIANNASMNNKDMKGMTPLHIACEKGHLGVVKYLVKKKAYINETDKQDKRPLHYASKLVRCNIAAILILNNAYVNKADKQGSTPLHIAYEFGNEEIVKLLIKHKAVTNCKNKKGLTPLDVRVTKQT